MTSSRGFSNSGIEPRCPTLQADALPLSHKGHKHLKDHKETGFKIFRGIPKQRSVKADQKVRLGSSISCYGKM